MAKNRVGLGTFPLSSVFNSITSKKAEDLVKKFIDSGGYYIDTAPLYGNGEVEKLIGRALKSIPREKYYIITKTIKHVDKAGNYLMSGKYNDVIEQIDNSLFRLGLEYVDQLMIHKPDDETPIEETLRAMEQLQENGKVVDLALSNVNLEELKSYNSTGKIKYIENSYSFINRSISEEFTGYLIKNKIHLIPYHLLEIGQLTEFVLSTQKLKEKDLRNKVAYWDDDNTNFVREFVKNKLKPIAEKLNISVAQLIIAWTLHQPYVDFVIVGTTKEKYLKTNMEANDIKLSDSVLEELENVYNSFAQTIKDKFGKSVREFRGLNEKYY